MRRLSSFFLPVLAMILSVLLGCTSSSDHSYSDWLPSNASAPGESAPFNPSAAQTMQQPTQQPTPQPMQLSASQRADTVRISGFPTPGANAGFDPRTLGAAGLESENETEEEIEEPAAILAKANRLYDNRRYNDAEKQYHRYINMVTASGQAWLTPHSYYRLGLIAEKRQQFAKAQEYLILAMQNDPEKNPIFTFEYARILYDTHEYDRARTLLAHLAVHSPEIPDVRYYLGMTMLHLNPGMDCFPLLEEKLGTEEACRLIAEKCRETGRVAVAEELEKRLETLQGEKDRLFFLQTSSNSIPANTNVVPTAAVPTAAVPTPVSPQIAPVPAAAAMNPITPQANPMPTITAMNPVPAAPASVQAAPTPISPSAPAASEATLPSNLLLPAMANYFGVSSSGDVSPSANAVPNAAPTVLPTPAPTLADFPTSASIPVPSAAPFAPVSDSSCSLGASHPGLRYDAAKPVAPEAFLPESAEGESPQPQPMAPEPWDFEPGFASSAPNASPNASANVPMTAQATTSMTPQITPQESISEIAMSVQKYPKTSSEEKLAAAIAAGATVENLTADQYRAEIAKRAGAINQEYQQELEKRRAEAARAPLR